MAGTVTQTWSNVAKNIIKLTFTWTADAAAATVPSTDSECAVDGWIMQVITNPGATAPTANYDIVLNNADSADVMGGALANRSATATEIAYPVILSAAQVGEAWFSGILTMVLSNNSVNSATGTIIVYIRTP